MRDTRIGIEERTKIVHDKDSDALQSKSSEIDDIFGGQAQFYNKSSE